MSSEERMALSDRELLVRIDTRLEAVIEDKKDHEKRIRTLEDRRYISPKQFWLGFSGAVATGSALWPLIQWAGTK